MSAETSQKLKPLFIALGAIAVVIAVIVKAPDVVRTISG